MPLGEKPEGYRKETHMKGPVGADGKMEIGARRTGEEGRRES